MRKNATHAGVFELMQGEINGVLYVRECVTVRFVAVIQGSQRLNVKEWKGMAESLNGKERRRIEEERGLKSTRYFHGSSAPLPQRQARKNEKMKRKQRKTKQDPHLPDPGDLADSRPLCSEGMIGSSESACSSLCRCLVPQN